MLTNVLHHGKYPPAVQKRQISRFRTTLWLGRKYPQSATTANKIWSIGKRGCKLQSFLYNGHRPTLRGTWENFGKTRVGWEKVACWSTKAAISLKRVKIQEKLLWRAYRKSAMLFQTVPSPTPCGFIFHKIGLRNPHPKLQSLLCQERVKLRTSDLAEIFTGSIRTKPQISENKELGRIQRLLNRFAALTSASTLTSMKLPGLDLGLNWDSIEAATLLLGFLSTPYYLRNG